MNDQAENLRKLLHKSCSEHKETKVIAVVSGKGGVGKSNFSLNFALQLSKIGKKVLLFDLDIGMANVDILLGVSSKYSIVDMIDRDLSILDIIEEGPEGLSFIAGGSGLTTSFQLNPRKLARFLQQLEKINGRYDYFIFDMGAGATKDSLQFILASHQIFVVTTPEPTSVTDAYAMIKYIQMKDRVIPISLVVNRAETTTEGMKTFDNLKLVTEQFLQKQIDLIGVIPNDPLVLKAVKTQKPFILMKPESKPSKAVKEIVSDFIGENNSPEQPALGSFIHKFKTFFQLK